MRVDEKHFSAGATCKMYKGNLVSFSEFGDVPVAFKESIVPVTRGTKRSISKEVGFFRQLKHQNVIKFFGIEKSRYMLAYEMMGKKVNVDGEELLVHDVRMLLDELEDSLPWNIRLHIAHSGAEGLSYLHSKGIIHRDVKAANYFISGVPSNSEWIIKIGDFAEAVYQQKQTTLTITSSQASQGRNSTKESCRRLVGTVPFIAPKIGKPDARHAQLSDVYSFSLFLHELAFPSNPHPWYRVCEIPELIVSSAEKGVRPSLTNLNFPGGGGGEAFCDIMVKCWTGNASDRPKMSQVSAWLKQIGSSSVSRRQSESIPAAINCPMDREGDEDDGKMAVSVQPLANHQSKVAEEACDVLAQAYNANGGTLDKDIVNVFEENIAALDGTNARSLLTMKIVDTLSTSDFGAFRDVSTNLKGAVENIISTLPRKINRLRNINDHFSVEEAYYVLHENKLLLHQYNFKECLSTFKTGQSAGGESELEKALQTMAKNLQIPLLFILSLLSSSLLFTQ